MAFLSDLDKKISMLGQGAIQKTKEVTDSAKMSGQIRSIEAQKREALEQLGQFYYDLYLQYGGELSGEAAEIVARIQQMDEQKQRITEEMQKLRGTMYCPNCNTEIPANSKFCNVCGAKIDIIQSNKTENVQSGRTCSQCGAPLEADQLFCVNCGNKIEQPVEQEILEELQEDSEQETGTRVCPNCGSELKAEQKFCTTCGTKIL